MTVEIQENNAPETLDKNKFPVLVIEDEQTTGYLIKRFLESSGYKVTVVSDAEDGWDLIIKDYYPIMIIDWLLPGMDGIQLTTLIRKMNFPGYVFIIFLTGKTSTQDIIQALEAGADEYITKPFDRSELVARLNTAVRILQLEENLKKAYQKMIKDPMTGAYNRGFFTNRMPSEINRAIRYQRPLSFVLCDIDFFKEVNDTYGHVAGDKLLKLFVDSIRVITRREVDLIIRYGGEEFAIILPETHLPKAMQIVERIRHAIDKKLFNVNYQEIHFTVCFGVATYDPTLTPNAVTLEEIVNAADAKLYECKREGRNRSKGIVLHSDEPIASDPQ